MSKTNDYLKSNSVRTLDGLAGITKETKSLYHKIRSKSNASQSDLQTLSKMVCGDLNSSNCKIKYGGVQPNERREEWTGKITLKNKTLGIYWNSSIKIYKHTAVRQQEITAKVAVDTLIHELCHHFDYTIVKLAKSLHTSGFYYRIGSLTTTLDN